MKIPLPENIVCGRDGLLTRRMLDLPESRGVLLECLDGKLAYQFKPGKVSIVAAANTDDSLAAVVWFRGNLRNLDSIKIIRGEERGLLPERRWS